MLRKVLRLLGADLDQKIAEIRSQADEFRVRTARQVTEQVKDIGLTVASALAGTIAATATFAIVIVALYRWLDMRFGPFVALAAIGVVMASLASSTRTDSKPLFLACWRRWRWSA
jgi:preprotein translocase subunit SecF